MLNLLKGEVYACAKKFPAFLIWVLFVSLSLPAAAQSQKIVPPTPNVNKITEYHAQRPNMYTGTANVSIPLHTINFDGWDLPLSISYNATGVRTNEEASEVGLGWALNATGIISRTVRGGDDLFPGSTSGGRGYVYNERPISLENLGTKLDLGYDWKTQSFPPANSYYTHVAATKPDTQPDIFNYNFFGYSGSFVLTQKAVSPTITALKITQDACSIFFDEPNQTFAVITPQGFKGEFTVKERSTSFSGSANTSNRMLCCGENNIDMTAMVNQSGRFRTVTTWYLTKISSPRGQQITFNYDLRVAANDGINYSPSYPDGTLYSPYISNIRAFSELEDTNSQESCLQTVQEHIYLKNIVSDEVQVDFLMENREDLRRNYLFAPDSGSWKAFHRSENLKRYSGIVITGKDPASTLNKVIALTQSYFNQQFQDSFANNQNERELRWLRSRLDRVKIDYQEYQFFYEKGAKGVPNKLTTGIDHFGFYNGQDQIMRLLPPQATKASCSLSDTLNSTDYQQRWDRRVDFATGIAGTLSKVKYPTRGWTTFEYEPHTYLPDGYLSDGATPNNTLTFIEVPGQKMAGGVRIKTIKEFDYTNALAPVRTKNYRYADNAANPSSATTGKLMTPLYNRYIKLFRNLNQAPTYPVTDCAFMFQTNSSIPGNNSAEGKLIGYSKVHEIVVGESDSYRNTFYFENTPNKVKKWNLAVAGKPNLNGQLIESRNLDASGKVVQRTFNEDYEHTIDSVNSIVYTQGVGNDGIPSPYFIFHTVSAVKRVFNTPYKTTTQLAVSPSGMVEDSNGGIVTTGNYSQTSTNLIYNTTGANANFLLRRQETISSKNEVIAKEFKRPADYATPSATLAYMKNPNVNMQDVVIEETARLNGTVTSATGNRYELENGRVNLKATYTYNTVNSFVGSIDGLTFGNGYELSEDFTHYDAVSGKLQQYTDRGGVVNSFIWGYNNKLPIVQGVGLTFSDLNAAYSASLAVGTLGSNSFEASIRSHSNTIGKQITTYLHNPQVGVTQVTSPANAKKTFQYDTYGRLQKVLDKDGYTTDQYQYHFKERQPTRIASISGNLNFGVLTPDMYAAQFIPYARCSDPLRTKIISISNDGEDDLMVHSISVSPPTSAFVFSWQGGRISPNTTVDVSVTFDHNVSLANYSGTVVISSDRTNTQNIDVPISANYTNRTCGLSFSPVTGSNPAVFDVGTTTGSFATNYLQITNTGNATLRLAGTPINWDGVNTNYNSFTSPDFNITANSNCIDPGQSILLQINFTPQLGPNGLRSAKVSFITDVGGCPSLKDAVTIQGNVQRPISIISVATNPSPLDFGSFTEAYKSTPITISNTGSLAFTVSGISVADASVASWFTLSPSAWTLDPGASKDFILTFQPATKDQTVNTTITINNDAMYGNGTFQVTGRRYTLKKILLSTEPSNLLVFNNQNDIRPVTITNALESNENLSVTGFLPPNTSLLGWAVISFTPSVLAPGQSTTMQLRRNGASPPDETITVQSDKNVGTNTFNIKALTRNISLTTSPSTNLPSFSAPSISQSITVSNSGESTLSVWGITSSNSMFTVSPTTLTVPPNSQQNVTVTFTPDPFNFSPQSTTLNFGSDATSGTGLITISGQRSIVRDIQLSANSLVFNSTGQTQNVTVANSITSNDNLNITGVTYPSTSNWYATITPTLLQPGQSTNLAITRTTGINEPINFTVNSNRLTGNEVVQVASNTRIINISPTSISMPAFSDASISQNITVSNNGNATLSVSSASCSNSMFTVSPSSFAISPGNQQIVTITYTPTAFNFAQQSASISFNGDQTSGGNTLSASGQRTPLRTIQLSTNNLSFTSTGQQQSVTVSNVGNDYLNVTGVSYPSTPNWSASITPANLAPGQSTTMTAMLLPGSSPEVLNISVVSNKNGGNEVLQVTSNVPSAPRISLSSVTFPSFTGSNISQTLIITNTGNSQLNVNNITSSNSRFTISPTSFAVAGNNGQQTVTVTYTPSDFSLQNTTLTVASDATSGTNTVNTSAQRSQLAQLSPSTTLLAVKVSDQTPAAYLTNTGNVAVTINSPGSNSNPANFAIAHRTFNGVVFTNATFPVTLQPGQQLQIVASTAQSGVYSSANGTLTINTTNAGSIVISLTRSTF